MAAEVSMPTRTRARRRVARALAVCVPAVVAGALVAPTLAGAAGSSATTGLAKVGSAPLLPHGARAIGALTPSASVSLDVALRPANPAALEQFANEVSDPSSPEYRHFLAQGAFKARFGPSQATTAAVRRTLAAAGLSVGTASADGLLLHVSGSASQVSSALHVSLKRYRLSSGRVGFSATTAPRLAASVSGAVVGITGLSTLQRAEPLLQATAHGSKGGGTAGAATTSESVSAPSGATTGHATGPTACTAAKHAATAYDLNPWTQIAKAYGFTAAYSHGDLGAGSTVGIFELEPYSSSNLAAFESCFALPGTAHYGAVHNVAIDGGAGAGPGSGEAILDVEDVLALAPGTNVVMYNAPNTNVGSLDEYDAMVSDDTAQVISTSWGECEPFVTPTVQSAENEMFQEAAAQGQSVFAAAGDQGSEDCHRFTATVPATTTITPTPQFTTVLAVDDPASQPYVTGVGGTQLTLTATHPTVPHEVVWNSDTGPGKKRQIAGGGGVSARWGKPGWQATGRGSVPTPGTGTCAVTPGAAAHSTACRQVPDVSATADPTVGGDEIYCLGASLCTTFATFPNLTGWAGVGGTSDAAPLWAAFTSLANASCGGDVGFLNPRLYALGDTHGDFHDVTSGTNDATGAHPGVYTAAAGYDNASGLGSPDGAALLSALCPAAVGSPTVQLSTATAGATATYTVTFTTTGSLASEDTVTLVGPAGTAFPLAVADYAMTDGPSHTVNSIQAAAPFSTGSSASANAVTLTFASAISKTAGVKVVTHTVVSATAAGDHTLGVQTTAATSTTAQAGFTLTAGAPTPSRSTVVAATPSVPDDGTTTDAVAVTVLDKWGNPVATAPVTLAGTLTLGASAPTVHPASVTTSAEGTAVFSVADAGPAEAAFAATVNGSVTVTQTATVDFTALSTASASLVPATAGATTSISAAFTTPVALGAGATVSMAAPPGAVVPASRSGYTVGTSTPTSVTVAHGPGSGSANQATLTLATGVAATAAVSVKVTTAINPSKAGLSFVALSTSLDPVPVDPGVAIVTGAPTPATSTVTVRTPSGPADGLSADTVDATVRDRAGNLVAGANVAMSQSGSATFTPTPPIATTGSSGTATFQIFDATAQTVTVTAKATGTTIGTAKISFTGISALDYLPLTTFTTNGTTDFVTGARVDVEAFAQIPGPLKAGTTVTLATPPGTTLPSSSLDYELVTGFNKTQAIKSFARTKGAGSSTTNVVTLTLASPSRLDTRSEFVIVAVVGATNPAKPGTIYATIAASGPGDTTPSSSQPLTFVTGPPSRSTSTVVASPSSVSQGGSSHVTVTEEDAAGNRLPGRVVSLTATAGNATISGDGSTATPHQATTSATGSAAFVVADVTAQSVTFNARDVKANAGIGSATVAFTAPHTTPPPPPPPPPPPATSAGYDLVGSDGGVFVFNAPGTAGGYYGSLPSKHVIPAAPVVGMVPTTTDQGYFLVGSDGGVFSFGNARFLGSLPTKKVVPNQPITGIVAANTDRGYFLVGRDGGVFAFGTVPFLGSLPTEGISVNNIIGIAATPSGNGYWLISATGTVYTFGVPKLGTVKGTPSPVSAIAGTPTGNGYWITTQNGAVYAFGKAGKFGAGTLPNLGVAPAHPVIGIVHTVDTGGYWLLGSDGGIFAFGDAPFIGSLPGLTIHVSNIVGAVPT